MILFLMVIRMPKKNRCRALGKKNVKISFQIWKKVLKVILVLLTSTRCTGIENLLECYLINPLTCPIFLK